jgi:hypothetical protein
MICQIGARDGASVENNGEQNGAKQPALQLCLHLWKSLLRVQTNFLSMQNHEN